MQIYSKIAIVSFLFVAIFFVQNIFFLEHPKMDFYHWKQTYDVSEDNPLKPHYIKCIDIGYERKKVVYRYTHFKTSPKTKIVPVVYIDNKVLSHIESKELARKISQDIKRLAKDASYLYEKIEIDCDWTARSAQQYFAMLKELKIITAKKIEVTIRLHQIKYASKTGVPPADNGVLMYYNMSDFTSLDTKNYILDLDVAKRYHYNFDAYPLELDLALPLYRQATVIRFSKVIGAIEGVSKDEIMEKNFTHLSHNVYLVTKEHYLGGKLLYVGDKVRFDSVSLSLIKEAISQLKPIIKRPRKIVFFRWGNLDNFEIKELEDIAKSY